MGYLSNSSASLSFNALSPPFKNSSCRFIMAIFAGSRCVWLTNFFPNSPCPLLVFYCLDTASLKVRFFWLRTPKLVPALLLPEIEFFFEPRFSTERSIRIDEMSFKGLKWCSFSSYAFPMCCAKSTWSEYSLSKLERTRGCGSFSFTLI